MMMMTMMNKNNSRHNCNYSNSVSVNTSRDRIISSSDAYSYNDYGAPFLCNTSNVFGNNVNMNEVNNNVHNAHIPLNKQGNIDVNSLSDVCNVNVNNVHNMCNNAITCNAISGICTTRPQSSGAMSIAPFANNHHTLFFPPMVINEEDDKKICHDYNIHKPVTMFDECERNRRLHIPFKSLSKPQRQLLVQRNAAHSDLLRRTIHLRFLPLMMKQSELASLCGSCGVYLRVRICGNNNSGSNKSKRNSNNNSNSNSSTNWVYGFV